MAYLQEVSRKVSIVIDQAPVTSVAQGVSNMEMEALVFAALTHMAGIRSALHCISMHCTAHYCNVLQCTAIS